MRLNLARARVEMQQTKSRSDGPNVAELGWARANLGPCPLCAEACCVPRCHGSYSRVKPAGTLIDRFLCVALGRTLSLLPIELASHVSGTLDEIEAAVSVAETAPSRDAAVEILRPCESANAVTSTSAERWLRRRIVWVRRALLTVITLLPDELACVPATVAGMRSHLGTTSALETLREMVHEHLQELSWPVGFGQRGRR